MPADLTTLSCAPAVRAAPVSSLVVFVGILLKIEKIMRRQNTALYGS